jgi:hypothetical protein
LQRYLGSIWMNLNAEQVLDGIGELELNFIKCGDHGYKY